MKLNKLFIFPLLAILASCSNPNNAEESSIVSIKGTILNPRSEVATFRGKDTTYTANVDSMGQFSITFSLDSATYLDFFNGPERTAMYVYPGDNISLSIDTKLFDETISYEGSSTSSYLAKKYLMEEGFDFFGEIYFMSSEEEYSSYISDYKDSIMMHLNLIADTSFVATELKEMKEMTEYYAERQASMSKYSQSVRKYKWESNKVSMDYNFFVAMDSLNAPAFDSMLMNFSTELNQLLSLVDDTAFVSSVKSGIEKNNKAWRERKQATDNLPKPGEMAIGFTYPNKDSVNHSLSDFEGSLVYVDVWATWCGPCKAEIPSLQKLEADYHGKNITFLSVSVDTDREAWVDMVVNDNLGGVQLWADGWSQITKDYAIFGIPRFMLFDQEGKVISTDAPRPSDNEIRSMIEEYI